EGISAERSTITVDILATSDVHGWFVPYDFPSNKESSKGGLTLISSLVEDFRGQGKNVILADCGDSVQANLCEWLIDEEQHPVMTAFNTMGYDLWTFGNHEFNFSKAQRDNLVKQFNGAVLCGNVFEKGAETSELPATAVIERDGIRIGFIGMTTPLIQDFEKTSGRLDDYNVRNPLEVLRPAIDELKAQKADCIVGLIHEGLYEERGVYGSSIRDIAKEFPEFDVIIGGHTHEAVECEYENGVLLCQPGVYAQTVSDIELSFTAADDGAVLTGKTSRIIPCGSENDAELYDALLPYKQRISDIMDSEIGELKGAGLSADSGIKGLSGVYTQASGIMNLFGSAAMYYSGADCALFCTDNEYAGFPEGPIKISDIMNSFTYSAGEVTVYELSGAQLRRILEWCGDYYNRMEDGDLLPSYNPARRAGKYSTNYLASGISFEVDLTAESGSCVKNLSLIRKNGSCTPDFAEDGSLQLLPIADSDTVKLATTQYAMEGSWAGEGCILAGADIPCVFSSTEEYGESEGTVRSLTIKYIRDVCGGEVDGSQFAYDNWKLITGVDQNSEEYKTAVRMINSGTLELHSSEAGDTNIRSVSVNDIIQK
ncbi:MAG: 5'-nucleotidase C-terminal domain-containing protein, partial [Eubacteriales bacterium]|nr:5'-nucleotidase C-terminal domain-containing protein [Eubacteriales bacterium]